MILDTRRTEKFKAELQHLVNEALKTSGMSARSVSKDVVGHDGLVRDIRAGRIPSADKLEALFEAIGLEFYLGPPRETHPTPSLDIDDTDFAAIPRYEAQLAAGNGRLNDDADPVEHLAFSRKWLVKMNVLASQACLVGVTGDSMNPNLHDGDLVLIDRRKTSVRDRRIYAVIDIDGSALVKRLEIIPNEALILRSDNPDHDTIFRNGTDMNRVQVLGEVVWSGHTWT